MFFFYSFSFPARTLNKDLNNVIDELIKSERRVAADNRNDALKRKVINDLEEYLDFRIHHSNKHHAATINEEAKRNMHPGVFATGLRGKKEANKEIEELKSSAVEKSKDVSKDINIANSSEKKIDNMGKQLDEKFFKKLNDVLREIL